MSKKGMDVFDVLGYMFINAFKPTGEKLYSLIESIEQRDIVSLLSHIYDLLPPDKKQKFIEIVNKLQIHTRQNPVSKEEIEFFETVVGESLTKKETITKTQKEELGKIIDLRNRLSDNKS